MPINNKVLMGGQQAADDKEGEASEEITPGHLITYDTDPETFALHGTAGGAARPLVAVKAEWSGTNTTDVTPIDDPYASGDWMYAKLFDDGNRGALFVGAGGNAGGTGADISANYNVSAGDYLVSAGDGTLRALDTGNGDAPGAAVFVARESVDNSSASSATRLIVEAL